MADYLEEQTNLEEDTQRGKYLTFPLGLEIYGIEIRHVTEIIGIQPITEVPEMPSYVKGIINLRGKIIPVMDVRLRFKKEPKDYSDRTCVIVVEIQDNSIGLIVDGVSEVTNIAEEEIVPPPQINGEVQNHFINGIGKAGTDVKLLLDCEKLLSDGEVSVLNNIDSH